MATGAQNFGSQLGQLIFGQPDDGKAYYQGQALGAQVADRMASARKSRADAMIGEDRLDARQGINPGALTTAGYAPDQAALLGSILRSNDVVDLGKLGVLQAPTAGRALADAATATNLGDMTTANNHLALAQGKPLETTKVNEGQVFNPYADAGQHVNLTALGDATVGDKRASAAQHYAGATSDLAHARLFDKQTSVGGFNPNTGDGGAGALVPAVDPNGAHGNDYLTKIDPTKAAQVKALAEGRMAFPTGAALKSPYWQGMLQGVAQYDPTFDAVNYNARAGTRKAFTSGKEAQTVNSLNTVAEHLGTLSDYSAGLNNTSFQPYNRVKNAIAGTFGDPDIAKFNTAKKAVADEVAKVWRSSGGSEADIQENLRNLDGAQSPEQLNAAIGTLTKLIGGKVSALQDQYTSGMGTTKDLRPLVSPEAKSAFDKTLQRSGLNQNDFGNISDALQAASAPQQAAPQAAAPAQGSFHVGQIIMHNGKPYRVTGGDPNDPDVEPVQ
ncbi:hypothetical protein EAH88_11890 [Rhodanobacter glycinis]|uniref:Uncharacterized protein n=1 Tax=Rhodanobacter glycinis TaxID=582702 RepID=A0A502C475_9GAMM|nr:hypothetical protein [Rhodanobacter glycinis]TPG08325.1 hypothetical protein EAH88_11890 [Rhodanobacter glycinis]